jgi:hypothetical protein
MMFEQDKQDKLKRLHVLRIFNMLGMIAWREDKYGGAQQCIRLLHPLAWFWVVFLFVASIVIQGVPKTIKDIKYNLKHEAVWF